MSHPSRFDLPAGCEAALLALVALLACCLLAPHQAKGATGDLTYLTCIANEGLYGCEDPMDPIPTQSPLAGVGKMAMYDDDVYLLASGDPSAITHLSRNPDGSLAFEDCIAHLGEWGCDTPLSNSFNVPNGIVVSPDGKNVYVAAGGGGGGVGGITAFTRNANGSLTFLQCVADAGANGCTPAAKESLQPAISVAIAPDGKSVYAGTRGVVEGVTWLTRNADGTLTYGDCIANSGVAGCQEPPGDKDSLSPTDLEVSPDGAHLYAVSNNPADSITWFSVGAGGTLAYGDCIANNGANGCVDPPFDSLGLARSVEISPDGSTVYTGSYFSGNITSFSRNLGSGALIQGECLTDGGAAGCVSVPAPNAGVMEMSSDMAISPDGKTLYVTGNELGDTDSGSLVTVELGAGGGLLFRDCIANGGAAGCDAPTGGDSPLRTANGAIVSPDGQNVYVSGYFAWSVSSLFREAPPLPPLVEDTDPDSGADFNTPFVKGSGVPADATVEIFTNPTCTGSPLATGTGAEFNGSGIDAVVADNSTTTFYATAANTWGESACSTTSVTYVEVSAGPGATGTPTLTGTNPPSPANDNTPLVTGSAGAGTTVHIYGNASCSGSPLATGTAAILVSPGIEITVADNTTTSLHATATGVGGTSACSAGISYQEVTPGIAGPGDSSPGSGQLTGDGGASGQLRGGGPVLANASILGRKAIVKGRRAHLRIACAGDPAATCTGKVLIATRVRTGKRPRMVPVGKASYSLTVGQTRQVKVRLNKRGARLLRNGGRAGLRVKASGSGLAAKQLQLLRRR